MHRQRLARLVDHDPLSAIITGNTSAKHSRVASLSVILLITAGFGSGAKVAGGKQEDSFPKYPGSAIPPKLASIVQHDRAFIEALSATAGITVSDDEDKGGDVVGGESSNATTVESSAAASSSPRAISVQELLDAVSHIVSELLRDERTVVN